MSSTFTALIRETGLFKATKIYSQFKLEKGLFSIDFGNYPPMYLRAGSTDRRTFKQIYLSKEYDLSIPFAPKFIIDAGANIGLASLYFHVRYPDSQVLALEPETANYKTLLKNTQKFKQIECLQAGLWHRSEQLRITNPEAESWAFSVETGSGNATDVQGYTVTDLLNRHKRTYVDILKMDIEGAEFYIFQNGLPSWMKQTRLLIIELHEDMHPGLHVSFFKLFPEDRFLVESKGENYFIFNRELMR